jgi:hypothetical protein
LNGIFSLLAKTANAASPVFAQVKRRSVLCELEPVSGFEPLTIRLQGGRSAS